MSILPLSGYLQTALSYFTLQNVLIQDVTYEKVSGQEIAVSTIPRSIAAAIDPSNMKQLEILFGPGNVSQGDLLVYTEEELHIDDMHIPNGGLLQSFLVYSEIQYRILAYQDWTQQAGVRVYQARRHIEQ